MLKTKNQTKRIIYFEGHPKENNSIMITKICDGYETISKFFTTGECATRTLLNLYNLHAIRGTLIDGKLDINSSMSGPHHYFGFIDPFKAHTIIIDNSLPNYYSYPLSMVDDMKKKMIPETYITRLKNYNWIKGKFINTLNVEKIYEKLVNVDNGNIVNDSLFLNPGILELNYDRLNFNVIENAIDYDLTEFKAQIIKNDNPFSFNQDMINANKHAQHRLRVITYNYGKSYVDSYLMKGSGIFIEKHEFIQSITPLNDNCGIICH